MAATAHIGHDAPLGNQANTSGCKRRGFDELDGQHKLSCSVQIEKIGQESKNRGSMKRSKTTGFANQNVQRTLRSGAHTTRCVHAGIQAHIQREVAHIQRDACTYNEIVEGHWNSIVALALHLYQTIMYQAVTIPQQQTAARRA